MSGVEVIGLILGALPLAISAIEHYRDGLDPFKDYIRYDSTLKSLRTRLRIQQDLFEGTIQRLLLEDLSDAQIDRLFPDSSRPTDRALWGTDEIDGKLHRRLGKKYGNFMDVIREMEKVMRRLMDRLDVDIDQKPQWNDNLSTSSSSIIRRSQWEWRKIRRSFGRKEREALMREFERYNQDIARYTEQREILVPPSKPKPVEFSRYYHAVRDQACGLYEMLAGGWNCHKSCSHAANLDLERRNKSRDLTCFNISLSLFDESSGAGNNKAWIKARALITEIDHESLDSSRDKGSLKVPKIPCDDVTTDIALHSSPVGNSIHRSVKIVEPMSETRTLPKLKDLSISKPNDNDCTPFAQISSLCDTLRAARSPYGYLGLLTDDANKRRISITATTLISPSKAEAVPLSLFIPSHTVTNQNRKPLGRLTRAQRLDIAVTLADSVLQLHQTPWLKEEWSKSDVHFFLHGVDKSNRPIIEHPYLSHFFQIPAKLNQSGPSETVKRIDFGHNQIINKSLFGLGIVLIELCLNQSIEELCSEFRDSNLPTFKGLLSAAELYGVATSLIDRVYEEQGTQYGYVVQRCLKCEFGVQDSKKQLDNDDFRALVYEGVLAPLEDDLKRYSI